MNDILNDMKKEYDREFQKVQAELNRIEGLLWGIDQILKGGKDEHMLKMQ